jgi:hypothetical protein
VDGGQEGEVVFRDSEHKFFFSIFQSIEIVKDHSLVVFSSFG